jgi:Predicted phosphatases
MDIQLVVFDMAGTTVVDNDNVNNAFKESFASVNIDVPSEDINKLMGYKKIDAIKIVVEQYAPELSSDTRVVNDLHEVFINNMINFYKHDPSIKPLPFAEEVFAELKRLKIKVALNTGFTRSIADVVLERLGWKNSELINETICSDEVAEGRPYPFMIQRLMEKLLITNARSVAKVGDTEVDVKEGRNAGCGLVVAVSTGSYTRQELQNYHPDFIIDSLNELLPIIKNK